MSDSSSSGSRKRGRSPSPDSGSGNDDKSDFSSDNPVRIRSTVTKEKGDQSPPSKVARTKRSSYRRYSSSSSSTDDKDDKDDEKIRRKKLKKVDTKNPFSAFERQTRNKKKYRKPTEFVKESWLTIRGMNKSGKFDKDDDAKIDAWKDVANSAHLIKKYSGEIFSATTLDDGLSSIVHKGESSESKELIKNQKIFGSIGHLSLLAQEGFGKLYNKLDVFVRTNIGQPSQPNPEYVDGDTTHPKYIWSEYQLQTWQDFKAILGELQVDVSEPISNVSRIAASAYTQSLDARREKLITQIKKRNPNAATGISRIPPSSTSLFGGDHGKLEKVVKLAKDLGNNSKSSYSGGYSGGYSGRQTNNSFRSSSSFRSDNRKDRKHPYNKPKSSKFTRKDKDEKSGNAGRGRDK